jgi:hypothetical protein
MSTDQPALEPILLLPPPDSMNMDESNNTGSWLSSRSNGTSNGHGNSKGGDDADMDEGKTDVDSDVMGTQTVQLRKYGSGLGNLGNTCFMNSSIQCLAHTSPLQEYFLSNEYEADLNRDNPLGTGGELATEFAELMAEMWGTSASCQRRSVFPSSSSYNPDTSLVVYPRNFKYTLGKHAEQFMGYDQHDSQELATYLLDALHEDTNRVTKKPYVEKPEQGEDESDEEASKNAWQLHLQREDSSVLQHFMGQVKSRMFRSRMRTRINYVRSVHVSICSYSWLVGKNSASILCTIGSFAASEECIRNNFQGSGDAGAVEESERSARKTWFD